MAPGVGLLARGDGRAQHEAAVAVGHADHAVGHVLDLVARRRERPARRRARPGGARPGRDAPPARGGQRPARSRLGRAAASAAWPGRGRWSSGASSSAERRLVAVCRASPPPLEHPGGEHRRRDDEQRRRGAERQRRRAQAARRVQLPPARGLGRVDAGHGPRAESPRARAGRAPARTPAAAAGARRAARRPAARSSSCSGVDRVARRARRPARPARGSSRGSARALYAVSWHASLSLSITRCRRVPALVSVVPITAASSAFVSPAKNFSATSSRSRGCSDSSAAAHERPAQARLGRVVGDGPRAASAPPRAARDAAARAAARRARRCARCRTATPAAMPRDGPEAPAAAIGALEGERGDVLGREAVTQQRRDVRVHVVPARAVQPLELDVRRRLLARGECVAHTLTTSEGPIHHIIGMP